jgi:hypothetical protein
VESTETVHEIHFSFPDGFYFCSDQYHPRIVFVFDEIVVIGGAVLYFFSVRGFSVRDGLKFNI